MAKNKWGQTLYLVRVTETKQGKYFCNEQKAVDYANTLKNGLFPQHCLCVDTETGEILV